MTSIDGRDFGRLEGKVDLILYRLDGITTAQAAHETRLDVLETSNTRRLGILAGISMAVSAVITGFGLWIKSGGLL